LISDHQISIFDSRVGGIFHFLVFFKFFKLRILMLVILKRLRLHHQIGLKGESGVGLSLDVFLNVADKVGTG
jgi:hypothetical protein